MVFTYQWLCPLRKAAEAKGFSDPSGKLAAADRELSSASKAAKQPDHGTGGDVVKKPKKTRDS